MTDAIRDPRWDQAGPFTVHSEHEGIWTTGQFDSYLEALDAVEDLPTGTPVAITCAPDFPRSPMYLDTLPPYYGIEPK
jgi:hypothetical protein